MTDKDISQSEVKKKQEELRLELNTIYESFMIDEDMATSDQV